MQNPFQKVAGLFKQAVQHGDESVIGIDFGSAYLKVVQLRRKAGKAILETYGELALGPYAGLDIGRATKLPFDTLSSALSDLMREAHITTVRGAAAIPFASSLVTIIDMPPLGQKELATVVPIEARKYVPVPISEVHLDWWIIPEAPSRTFSPEKVRLDAADAASTPLQKDELVAPPSAPSAFSTRVLIAAIHNEALARFESATKGAGVETSFFEVEPFASARALLPDDLEPHALLDLGAGETKLYIIDRGLLRFSHMINHGAQDLTLALSRSLALSPAEAEKLKRRNGLSTDGSEEAAKSLRGLLDFVFAEANRGLRSFERRFKRTVKDLLLSGGGANLIGIEEFARESSSIPVSRANPFVRVEAPAFLDEVLRSVGPEFSVALGIAFRRLQETS